MPYELDPDRLPPLHADASDDEVRERVCTSKRSYSVTDAERALAELAAKGRTGLSRYRCPLCRRQHVGHPPSLEALERLALLIRGLPPADRLARVKGEHRPEEPHRG